MRAGTRLVRKRLERNRILALLDRLDAQAERVELLDLPKRWAREAQELAEAVKGSVRDIREFLIGSEGGGDGQNAKREPQTDSVSSPASRVPNGLPGMTGFPDNVHEFLTMCTGSARKRR